MWANSHVPLKYTCRSACFMGDVLGGGLVGGWGGAVFRCLGLCVCVCFFRGVAEQDGVRLSEPYYAGLSLSSVLGWVIRSERWALWPPLSK